MTMNEFNTIREDIREMSTRVNGLATKVEALAVSVAGCQPLCAADRARRSGAWKIVLGAFLSAGVGLIAKHFGG